MVPHEVVPLAADGDLKASPDDPLSRDEGLCQAPAKATSVEPS